MNHKQWDKKTKDFLDLRCNVDFDTLRLGSEKVPVALNGVVFNTLREYIDHCFEYRGLLLKYLNTSSSVKGTKEIEIYERYERGVVSYIVQLDKNKLLSFRIINDTLQIKSEENLDESSSLFADRFANEVDCFSQFESLPQKFWVFSRATSDGICPIKVTLSN